MEIINRIGHYRQKGREWFKRPVSDIEVLPAHHSASFDEGMTDDEILTALAEGHIKRGWPGLSYHFVIIRGKIYQINDFTEITWTDSVNVDSLATCVVGYFHPPHNHKISDENLRAYKWLMDKLSTEHPEMPADQDDVIAHRDRWATACCGDTFYPFVTDYRTHKGLVTWGRVEGDPEPQVEVVESGTSVQQVEPVNTDPAYVKQLEIDRKKFWEERDSALELKRQAEEKYNKANETLSAFAAAGYDSIEDITNLEKDRNDLRDENLGLKKSAKEAIDNASNLAGTYKASLEADSTAIDSGITAEHKLRDLEADLRAIASALGIKKLTLPAILNAIEILTSASEEDINKMKKNIFKQVQEHFEKTGDVAVSAGSTVKSRISRLVGSFLCLGMIVAIICFMLDIPLSQVVLAAIK